MIIADYFEKIGHHELQAAWAEEERRILQEELWRQQKDFREVHQQNHTEMEELQEFPSSTCGRELVHNELEIISRTKCFPTSSNTRRIVGIRRKCKGNVSCTWYSRTFYDIQMATANCVHHHAQLDLRPLLVAQLNFEHTSNNCMSAMTHTDVTTAQHWARCAAFSCVVVHAFIYRTCGSSLALSRGPCARGSFHVIHACALVFGCLSVLSSPVSLLLPQVSLPPLLDVYVRDLLQEFSWCLTRIPWKITCATPASGAWSAWTVIPDTPLRYIAVSWTTHKNVVVTPFHVQESFKHCSSWN